MVDKISLEDMYDEMRLNVASYSMGLCEAVKELFGKEGLIKVITKASENSGHNKAQKLRSSPKSAKALGMLLEEIEEMLYHFSTQNITTTQNEGRYRIDNPDCGCLPPFIQQSEEYGFTPKETRKYVCLRCMPPYREAAVQLGLGFNGKLTEKGCFMEFSEGCKDAKL